MTQSITGSVKKSQFLFLSGQFQTGGACAQDGEEEGGRMTVPGPHSARPALLPSAGRGPGAWGPAHARATRWGQ